MVFKKARSELFNSWFLLRNLFHIITTGKIQGMSGNFTLKKARFRISGNKNGLKPYFYQRNFCQTGKERKIWN